jgi:hypothetical protein
MPGEASDSSQRSIEPEAVQPSEKVRPSKAI